MTEQAPPSAGLSIEPVLAALVDIAFRDGRHELNRARGQRGTVRLHVEVTLGDNGEPMFSTSQLSFESKRHVKDAFVAREPK